MTYIPTNWQNGDTITAEKLNKNERATGTKFYQIEIEHIQGDDWLANATLYDLNNDEVSTEQVFQECKAGCAVFVNYRDTIVPLVYYVEDMDDYTDEVLYCFGETFGPIYQTSMEFSQFNISYIKNVEGSGNNEWRLNINSARLAFTAS